MTERDLERFLRNVVFDGSGCWLWSGTLHRNGYGSFRYLSATLAHRASWLMFCGDIPRGLKVLHGPCNDRSCVNPDHLMIGTQADNVEHMVRRDMTVSCGARHSAAVKVGVPRGDRHYLRTYPEKAPRGERCGTSKLSQFQVDEIRASAGFMTQGALAARFGVSQTQISRILRKVRWAS